MKRLLLAVLLVVMCLPASVFGQDEPTPTIPPGLTIHVVQRGETLYHIAGIYGTTFDQLAQLNGLDDPSSIYVGERLLVPAPGATPAPAPSVMHIVQPGETLESIAQLYGMSVDDLKAQNNLSDDPSSFYVGQLLNVSVDTPTPQPSDTPDAPSTPSAVVIHTVARGETIFRIAKQYGTTVNDIVQANHITNPQLIYAGQELVIPGAEVPQLALDLPASVQSIDVEPLIFTEGETGRIHLTTASGAQVTGTFDGETLNDAAEDDNTQHTLLVGIPVGTAADVYPLDLSVTASDGTTSPLSVNVQVISGGYGFQRIQLAPGLEDLLNPQLQNDELAELQQITSNFTPTRYFDGPMGLPVAAPLSAQFGDQRSYNGGAFSSIHTGTDFAAAPGTPIIAPAAGQVAFVGHLDIRGNVTILDHGWGVFTVYCHQTEQYVSVGDQISVGQVIGTTGSTGRVTGPHLHWELWVDGVVVDAMQWVSESFS